MAALPDPSPSDLRGYALFRDHLVEGLKLRCEVSWERRLPGIYGSDWSVSVVDAGGTQVLYGSTEDPHTEQGWGYAYWVADAERFQVRAREPFLLIGDEYRPKSQVLRAQVQLLAHATQHVALAQIDRYALRWRQFGFEERRTRYWEAIVPAIVWLRQLHGGDEGELQVTGDAVEAAIRKRWTEMVSGKRREKLLAERAAARRSGAADLEGFDGNPFWYDDGIPDAR